MSTITFWHGYGNFYGGYSLSHRGWEGRIPAQAKMIKAMGVSSMACLEMHVGDDDKNGRENRSAFLDAMGDNWAFAIGKGGNHWLYDLNKYEVISKKSILGPGKQIANGPDGRRWFSKFNVKRDNVPFWQIIAHLPANDDRDKTRARTRVQQTVSIVANTSTIQRGILSIDRNSAVNTLKYPRGILEASGWAGIREKSDTVPINYIENSHHSNSAPESHWIEDIHTKPLVKVLAGGLVKTTSISDHHWFKAKVQISKGII